jgi:hypothetical protein
MANRKTPEQRLDDAVAAKQRAEFDMLAARASALAWPRKHITAIAHALPLFGLLDWSDEEIEAAKEHLAERVESDEQVIARGKASMGES